jgi:hypothetical protein
MNTSHAAKGHEKFKMKLKHFTCRGLEEDGTGLEVYSKAKAVSSGTKYLRTDIEIIRK